MTDVQQNHLRSLTHLSSVLSHCEVDTVRLRTGKRITFHIGVASLLCTLPVRSFIRHDHSTLLSFNPSRLFHVFILHGVSTPLSFTAFPRFYPSRRFHVFILHGVSTFLSFTAFPRFYPSRPSENGSRLEGDDLKYGNCNGSRLQSYSDDIGACSPL